MGAVSKLVVLVGAVVLVVAPSKIEIAFRLLPVVMKQIKGHRGGNNFKVAHAQIRKQMHEEGYPHRGW